MHFDDAFVATPGVVKIRCNLGNLDVGKGRDGRHGLVEAYAVHGQFAAFSVADNTKRGILVFIDKVRPIERWIDPAKTGLKYDLASLSDRVLNPQRIRRPPSC